MKVLVVGGGVVAVTCAYFLARAGCEVTVIEEKDALGLEATAGNAGIIAPGHAFAWGSPRAPRMLLRSLRGRRPRSACASSPIPISLPGGSGSSASARLGAPTGTPW